MNNIKLIDKINASPQKAYLTITGGGTTFIGEFMSREGASKTIVGVNVPYSKFMFDDFVKCKIDKYVSEEASLKLATKSYQKCLEAGISQEDAVGIGVTCSLRSDNERKGRINQAWIGVHRHKSISYYNIVFHDDPEAFYSTRLGQEEMVAKSILEALADKPVSASSSSKTINIPLSYRKAIFSQNDILIIGDSVRNRWRKIKPKKFVPIFCGSWNPRHKGHNGMIKLAEEILGEEVTLELSVKNADKGVLNYAEILERKKEMEEYPYIITNQATFRDKASCLRDIIAESKPIVFIMGYDTWVRIWDEDYYNAIDVDELAESFFNHNIKFLVFGRDGKKLRKNAHPDMFDKSFLIKSEIANDYKCAVSSTKERTKRTSGNYPLDL